MKFFRCPTCLLIPRIISVDIRIKKIFLRYLCPNKHSEIINYKQVKKFSLDKIKCNECDNNNNKLEYYCKECFNILCNKCIKIHEERTNHKNIIDINTIDDNCLIHNDINILYCNNCEEDICNKCIKSQKHKGHEINELKLLDLKDLKNKCIKFKNNVANKLERLKLNLLEGKISSLNNSDYFPINDKNDIHNRIKKLKIINLDIVDLILDMINDFEKYKKAKKKNNYMIYLNSKIIGNLISYKYLDGTEYKSWYCKNYNIYKTELLKDYIKDNEFFFNKDLTNRTILNYSHHQNIYHIHYCNFNMNENNEGILIYLNENTLCYRNIETLNDYKKIIIKYMKINYNNAYTKYLRLCEKEYLLIYNYLGSFEVFLINDNRSEKISSVIKEEDTNQQEETFDSQFLFTSINYFNKKIYVSSFYKHKIYIYNVFLNQLEIIINIDDEILFRFNKYFINNNNNIYDFLFITTNKQCFIYELKKFSIKKKLYLKDVYYVLLSEFYNKSCFFISAYYELIIIDFITDDILYKMLTNRTKYLFLWNKYTLIENYQIDSCAGNSLLNLFDGKKEEVLENDFWWTEEIFRIKLKKYGECLLRIGEEKTNLFYIRPENEKEKKSKEFNFMDFYYGPDWCGT